jgi:hypothetical protein
VIDKLKVAPMLIGRREMVCTVATVAVVQMLWHR